MRATSANSRAAYVHIYSLIAAIKQANGYTVINFHREKRTRNLRGSAIPRMMANVDAKRPNVNANGAVITIALVFKS